MKVFIPISDAQLSDRGELCGTPVPFTLDLLAKRAVSREKQEFSQRAPVANLLEGKQKLNSQTS